MFSEITKSQQRMWKMTIAVIAQSGSRFWSRHILISGSDEKLQNTNCTETFLQAAKMRHKHYTPGHFPANNNNSERFFKFMLLVSASFYHSCPGFDGMRSTENVSRQVLFEKLYFRDLHFKDNSTNLSSVTASANTCLMSNSFSVNIV